MHIWEVMKIFIALLILIGCSLPAFCGKQKYEVVRTLYVADALASCWDEMNRLSGKFPELSPKQLFKLYQCEKKVFNSILLTFEEYENQMPGAEFSDWNVAGLKYLKAHPDRYTEKIIGKYHDPMAQRFPSRVFLDEIIKKAPDSPERWAMEWDLDYGDFIRQFSYVVSGAAKGKSCAQYYDERLKDVSDISEEAVDEVKKDCEADRAEYTKGLKVLLKRYEGKPVVPKLYDPDETNVVSDKSLGLSPR